MIKDKVLKKQYYSYIIPSIVSQIVYSTYMLVDGIFVARGVSETALAGVNIALPFMTFLWAMSLMFAAGTSTVSARLLGEGKPKEASRVFSRNMTAMAILGIVISLVVMIALEPFCKLLGAGEETLPYLRTYIGVIAPFSLFFVASYTFEILTATDGYPKLATVTVSLGVVANIVLDYIFILVLDKGVWGAAFATAIAQVLVIIVYLIHFLGPKATIRFCRFFRGEDAEDLKTQLTELLKSLSKGVPAGINEMSPGLITFIYVHAIVTYLSEKEVVAYSAATAISYLIVFIAVGIAQGCQPLMSFYNGRRDEKSKNKLMQYQYKSVITLLVPAIIIVAILAEPIVKLFLTSGETMFEYSAHVLRIFVVSCLFAGFNVVFSSYFTSQEKPLQATTISICRCMVMLIVGVLLSAMLLGANQIWWGMSISEILTLAVALVLYKRK